MIKNTTESQPFKTVSGKHAQSQVLNIPNIFFQVFPSETIPRGTILKRWIRSNGQLWIRGSLRYPSRYLLQLVTGQGIRPPKEQQIRRTRCSTLRSKTVLSLSSNFQCHKYVGKSTWSPKLPDLLDHNYQPQITISEANKNNVTNNECVRIEESIRLHKSEIDVD